MEELGCPAFRPVGLAQGPEDQVPFEGLHHIGFLTDDLDGEIAGLKKAGVGIWTKGRAGLGFIYSDPTPVGGLAIEFRERVPPPPKTAKK